MVLTTGAITKAVQRFDVVDLAVSAFSGATRLSTAVLCATFCSRAGKPPNVFALPGSTACIGAPCASALASDDLVTPVTASWFACPCRQSTRNSFGHKWRQLQFVNRVFRWCAFSGHVCSQTITLTKQSVDTLEILTD